MQLWPFKRRQPEQLSVIELRDRLVAAANGPKPKLKAFCDQYKDQIAGHLDELSKVPEGLDSNPAALDRHVQALATVAQCLANDCEAPELWERLVGSSDTNPFGPLNEWLENLARRKALLEFPTLINEAQQFLQKAGTFQGPAARQTEAVIQGHLGLLLLHSGRGRDAETAFRQALKLCIDSHDVDGQGVYLNHLFETYRYLGEAKEALYVGDDLIRFLEKQGQSTELIKRRIDRLRQGEPLCRVICLHNGVEREIDEFQQVATGHFEFQLRRNRMSLELAELLVKQGNDLGSQGKLNEALDKYQQARQVDPFAPDPAYQSSVCHMELGNYSAARTSLDEVERLAPGWFRCRSDQWLARSLEEGKVSAREFKILRVVEDGGLPADQIISVSHQTLKARPQFAPLYLVLGDQFSEQNDLSAAIVCYRKGLEHVSEPDLESRLLCAMAAILPTESPERKAALEKILDLKGNLIAQATARLMLLK